MAVSNGPIISMLMTVAIAVQLTSKYAIWDFKVIAMGAVGGMGLVLIGLWVEAYKPQWIEALLNSRPNAPSAIVGNVWGNTGQYIWWGIYFCAFSILLKSMPPKTDPQFPIYAFAVMMMATLLGMEVGKKIQDKLESGAPEKIPKGRRAREAAAAAYAKSKLDEFDKQTESRNLGTVHEASTTDVADKYSAKK